MNVRYRARALADIDGIYRYLSERSPSGAHNVVLAIHASIESAAAHPHGFFQTDDPGIRVISVRRYRYRIFYTVDEDGIEILHVRHTSRRPWIRRAAP